MSVKTAIRRFLWDDGKEMQRLRRWVKILLLLALFAGLFWIVPLDQVVQQIFSADPLLLLIGMVLGFLSTALTAAEIEPLTRNQGIRRSIWQILEINLAVKFYSQFTPTTLVGSGLRWYRLAHPGNKAAESLAALAFFRVLETFLTISTGLVFWILAGQEHVQANLGWLGLAIAAILAGWYIATRKSLTMYAWLKSHGASFLESSRWRPVGRRIEKYLSALSAYASMPALDLLAAVGAGVLSVLTGIGSGLYLANAVGIDIGYLDMGWIQAVVLLTAQLPFAVAGGLGLREVTLVAVLGAFGVGAELALAFSLLLFGRGLLISLLGGALEGLRALRAGPVEVEPAPETPRDH